ncbi:MAG: DUF937 domain-containing protein [Hoeflea sp.]|uniref:DUF937 domain-containing protein n=1 Tax=Hoeflea sp. TaxID=1940281 RepID=UPI0032EAC1F1
MMPLFDMMKSAQNGEAMRAMASQFGLSETQVEQAMEALMPAFSTGLKRNAKTPADMSDFVAALATGNHAKYFDDLQTAFSPKGVEEGNGILDHIFGSKEVSRAVASQAQSVTGIGQDILKQMLPVIATAVMGGLFKQSTGQMHASSTAGANPLGDLISEMMRQGLGGARATRSAQSSPMDNPMGKILEGMFGGGQQTGGSQSSQGANPFSDNPLGQIFQDMFGGALGGQKHQAPEPQTQPKPDTMPSGRPRNPYDDLFGQMFDSGRKVQQGYQENMESIFDQYLQGMNRR